MTITNLTNKLYTTHFNKYINANILEIDCEQIALRQGDSYLSGVKVTVEGNPCCFDPCDIDQVTISSGC